MTVCLEVTAHGRHYMLLSKRLSSTDYVCSWLTLLKRHKGMVFVLRLILLATCKWKGLNLQLLWLFSWPFLLEIQLP